MSAISIAKSSARYDYNDGMHYMRMTSCGSEICAQPITWAQGNAEAPQVGLHGPFYCYLCVGLSVLR